MATTLRTLESGYEVTGDSTLKVLAHQVGLAISTAEFVAKELIGAGSKP